MGSYIIYYIQFYSLDGQTATWQSYNVVTSQSEQLQVISTQVHNSVLKNDTVPPMRIIWIITVHLLQRNS